VTRLGVFLACFFVAFFTQMWPILLLVAVFYLLVWMLPG
jgi:hypothetical protein